MSKKLQFSILLFLVEFLFVNSLYPTNPRLIDFDEAMKHSKYYTPSLADKDPEWALVKKLYENTRKAKNNSTYLIPKIIHQIWLGPKPLPKGFHQRRRHWQELHPDWDYILWRDEDIKKFGLKNIRAYNAAKNWGEKSDIARYEILEKFGGLYIDTDFGCLKSFDEFHKNCTFYAGLGYWSKSKVELYNGLIGCAPEHPIIKECVKNIKIPRENFFSSRAIIWRSGPIYLTNILLKIAQKYPDRVLPAPVTYFYPWPDYLKVRGHSPYHSIKPESHAIHYWHCSWFK